MPIRILRPRYGKALRFGGGNRPARFARVESFVNVCDHRRGQIAVVTHAGPLHAVLRCWVASTPNSSDNLSLRFTPGGLRLRSSRTAARVVIRTAAPPTRRADQAGIPCRESFGMHSPNASPRIDGGEPRTEHRLGRVLFFNWLRVGLAGLKCTGSPSVSSRTIARTDEPHCKN